MVYFDATGRHSLRLRVAVVGATNILEQGYRLLVCGETVRLGRSKKQERRRNLLPLGRGGCQCY